MSWDWNKLDPRRWWEKTKVFSGEVKTEISKVSFPSRDEVIATTTVVLVASAVFAVYLFIVDQVIVISYQWVVGKLGS
jgi:preprotein translocase subunit SecE